MKTERSVKKYLLWPRQLTYVNKTVCAHKNKTLIMSSLTVGNVSSAPYSTIHGTLLARKCRNFVTLKLVYHMIF
jgi:hypothetical protein